MARRLHSEDGFTIVEVIVAMVVLLIGMLGVLSLLSGALLATAANNERVGATNLARELVEVTRGLDYEDLTSGLVVTRLQARSEFGSGSPWTIERRGVTYTVVATTCAYDDPADGYAASAPANACNPGNAAGSDANGDDFRRTTFTVSWRDARGPTKSSSQSTLIVNPSGGLGPRITCFTPVTQTYAPGAPPTPAACPAAAAVASTATVAKIVWTTTTAQSLHWEADDGASRGDLVGSANATGGTTFTTLWDIGDATAGNGSEVLDGPYIITGQAFDVRDIAGEAKRADIVLNRRAPYAPPSLQGGRNTRIGNRVDFRWDLNRERDVLGYRVMWAGNDGARGGGNDVQVCEIPTASYLSPTTQSCTDSPPTNEATTYYIVAIDSDSGGGLRPGAERFLPVGAPVAAPDPPSGLTQSTTADGQARLSWTAPAANAASPASDVAFYRIYRDDSDGNPATVEYSDRHDRVDPDPGPPASLATSYRDTESGPPSHKYWVTAVNSSYNESAPVGPVTWVAP